MSDSQTEPDPSSSSSQSSSGGVSAAVQHMSANKTEAGLWMTRFLSLMFTFLYLLPLGGVNQVSCYQKALMASAATSALRLHQRLPVFRLSREFLAVLVLEDSAHYFLFSLVFLFNSVPLSLALLPIALFSFLHFCSYTLVLFDKTRFNPNGLSRALTLVVQQYQRSILQTVALTEIMLMPALIFAIISGVSSLITPFVYYRFLSLRYSSRRNPYTRQMFHELRLSVEHLVYKPICPGFIRSVVLSLIALICRLSPISQ